MGLRCFFAGDVVITNQIEKQLLSEELSEIIQSCDVACCNFEAPVSFNKQKASTKIGPNLSQHKDTVKQLMSGGFNLFSLANNHIMDYGGDGLKNTLNILDSEDVAYIGAGFSADDIYAPYIFEKDKIRIGILSVAENGFGAYADQDRGSYAWYGSPIFDQKLDWLIENCNFVIIICHGGAEKWDFPLPEYRSLYRSWIDKWERIVVIAHHPHVPQGWEKYNNGYIFYSLGNFAFDKGAGIQNAETISVVLNIEETGITYEIIQTEFTKGGVIINNKHSFTDHLNKCNDILNSEEYIKKVNQKCIESFKRQYRKYYMAVSNIYTGSVKGLLKTIFFRYIRKQSFSELWLYHNLEIETHYWICRRALRLENREEEN